MKRDLMNSPEFVFGRRNGAAMTIALVLSLNLLFAEATRHFPEHWGEPPAIQTQDYVELPGGYGHGSSTLAKWIAAHLQQDKDRPQTASLPRTKVLYSNNFENAETGKLPEDFMSLNGEFLVKVAGTNKLLELPGAPLDSFAVQFGPTERTDVAVKARIFGTAKGRRYPTFGVGICGVSGYKLQIAPGKKALELLKDETVKASLPFDWKPGAWLRFHLRLHKVKDGEWRVEGKVWPEVSAEPKNWMLALDETEEPVAGRASVIGSPFSGTPIRFDDLVIERLEIE